MFLPTLYQGSGAVLRGLEGKATGTPEEAWPLEPGMGHIILNLEGPGLVTQDAERWRILPGMVALFRPSARGTAHTSRMESPSGRHRFAILSATPAWVIEHCGDSCAALHSLLIEKENTQRCVELRPLALTEKILGESLLTPPVLRGLRPAWFEGKILESLCLFGAIAEPGAPPATVHDPLQRRVEAATQWMDEHFREDLDLTAIAGHVGCTPAYLSRLFKQHTGKTLSQKLREIRVSSAATLLSGGSDNVSEAAYKVGYRSLSHFTKAFIAEKGCRPSDWLSR
ncbi:helix-turn-helix transcriptional regulator [Luteolibacter soli]|uniref:AraC family transcriptional regulator n=1 Tax=Luteolibacter soli TaxID=3135280 RepID=A0ABU9AYJ3_9BACT